MQLINDKIIYDSDAMVVYRMSDLTEIGYIWLVAGAWAGSGMEFSVIDSDGITDIQPSRECFLDWLKMTYPEDFKLILFHPEILKGVYREESN